MRTSKTVLSVLFLLICGNMVASAAPILYEWAFEIDGVFVTSWDATSATHYSGDPVNGAAVMPYVLSPGQM